MSELGPVLWIGFVIPPLRSVVDPSVGRGRRVVASMRSSSVLLASGLERFLMDPGPPRGWGCREL